MFLLRNNTNVVTERRLIQFLIVPNPDNTFILALRKSRAEKWFWHVRDDQLVDRVIDSVIWFLPAMSKQVIERLPLHQEIKRTIRPIELPELPHSGRWKELKWLQFLFQLTISAQVNEQQAVTWSVKLDGSEFNNLDYSVVVTTVSEAVAHLFLEKRSKLKI